jgi:hypothetical protein
MTSARPDSKVAHFAVWTGAVVAALLGIGMLAIAIAATVGWLSIGHLDFTRVGVGDLASLAVAGATLLLADFTAILAWLTRSSIKATQREAEIAEAALVASNRQAKIASDALAAAHQQAKIADRQVEATNKQAQIAQDQLSASWRPILTETSLLTSPGVTISPSLDKTFGVRVPFMNIGRGPAFVAKGMLGLGVAVTPTHNVLPKIVAPAVQVDLIFTISATANGVDKTIADALIDGQDLSVAVFYTDITGSIAWCSRGQFQHLEQTSTWIVRDVELTSVELALLH